MSSDVIPHGNPSALFCRWCTARRQEGPRGGLFCEECDGFALKTAQESKGGTR